MVMSALTAVTKSTQSHSIETKMDAIWHEFLSAGESGIIESREEGQPGFFHWSTKDSSSTLLELANISFPEMMLKNEQFLSTWLHGMLFGALCVCVVYSQLWSPQSADSHPCMLFSICQAA